jgi:hypothetical protein
MNDPFPIFPNVWTFTRRGNNKNPFAPNLYPHFALRRRARRESKCQTAQKKE